MSQYVIKVLSDAYLNVNIILREIVLLIDTCSLWGNLINLCGNHRLPHKCMRLPHNLCGYLINYKVTSWNLWGYLINLYGNLLSYILTHFVRHTGTRWSCWPLRNNQQNHCVPAQPRKSGLGKTSRQEKLFAYTFIHIVFWMAGGNVFVIHRITLKWKTINYSK